MSSILLFVWAGSPSQVCAAFVITITSLLVVTVLRPYADPYVGLMQCTSLLCQAVTLLSGLLLITQKFDEIIGQNDANERRVLGAILMMLHVMTFVSPLVQLLVSWVLTSARKVIKRSNKRHQEPNSEVEAGCAKFSGLTEIEDNNNQLLSDSVVIMPAFVPKDSHQVAVREANFVQVGDNTPMCLN
jgi:hypothetical protein